jgi:hypothetical protein
LALLYEFYAFVAQRAGKPDSSSHPPNVRAHPPQTSGDFRLALVAETNGSTAPGTFVLCVAFVFAANKLRILSNLALTLKSLKVLPSYLRNPDRNVCLNMGNFLPNVRNQKSRNV